MDQVTVPKVPDGKAKTGLAIPFIEAHYRQITATLAAYIGDENARSRSRPLKQGSSHVTAASIRISSGQAGGVRAGDARAGINASAGLQQQDMLRKARQAETASQMDEWLNSPGLRSPK